MSEVPERKLFVAVDEFTDEGQATLLGKMRGLHRDPQAGFLPTTHLEKNNAFELLDYAGEHCDEKFMPQYRLQEIFKHQIKLFRRSHGSENGGKLSDEDYESATKAAQRSLLSVGTAWGDFLINAKESSQELAVVANAVNDCPNPKVVIAEEIDPHHAGVAALMRYIDLNRIREKGYTVTWGFDPMGTVTERVASKDSVEIRHTFTRDQYTNPHRKEIVTNRIEYLANTLTIGSLRKIVPKAQEDQDKRFSFWRGRVSEMYQYHLAGRPAAKLALTEAGLELPKR